MTADFGFSPLYHWVTESLLRNRKRAELNILQAIANRVNQIGVTTAGIQLIGEVAGYSRDTVIRVYNEFIAAGWIIRYTRQDPVTLNFATFTQISPNLIYITARNGYLDQAWGLWRNFSGQNVTPDLQQKESESQSEQPLEQESETTSPSNTTFEGAKAIPAPHEFIPQIIPLDPTARQEQGQGHAAIAAPTAPNGAKRTDPPPGAAAPPPPPARSGAQQKSAERTKYESPLEIAELETAAKELHAAAGSTLWQCRQLTDQHGAARVIAALAVLDDAQRKATVRNPYGLVVYWLRGGMIGGDAPAVPIGGGYGRFVRSRPEHGSVYEDSQ